MYFPEQIKTEALKTASVAVLASGGIESAFLVYALAKYFARVYPLYIRCGLAWEKVEHQSLLQYLQAIESQGIEVATVLDMSVTDLYGKHWSTTGNAILGADTDDEAVYLPGRNLLLLTKAAIWCAINKVEYIALGCLQSNPFPDAMPEFFDHLERSLVVGLGSRITILRPLSKMHKGNVISLGADLPLHLTFSCINPVIVEDEAMPKRQVNGFNWMHCGDCNKCGERRKAFIEAQVEDHTPYLSAIV